MQNKKIYKFILTNQSGIGRGFFSESQFLNFQKSYNTKLYEKGILFDDIYFCPHHPEEAKKKYKKKCMCRKPNNGMIEKLLKQWMLSRKDVCMIGDKRSDFLASRKSNIRFIYAQENRVKLENFFK